MYTFFYNISSYWTKYHCCKMKTKDIKKWMRKRKTFSEMFNNKFSVLQYFPFLSHEHNVIESIAIENKERKRKKKVIINYFSTFSWIVRDIQFFRSFFIALTRCQKPRWFLRALLCFIISTLCWMKVRKKKKKMKRLKWMSHAWDEPMQWIVID